MSATTVVARRHKGGPYHAESSITPGVAACDQRLQLDMSSALRAGIVAVGQRCCRQGCVGVWPKAKEP